MILKVTLGCGILLLRTQKDELPGQINHTGIKFTRISQKRRSQGRCLLRASPDKEPPSSGASWPGRLRTDAETVANLSTSERQRQAFDFLFVLISTVKTEVRIPLSELCGKPFAPAPDSKKKVQ